MFCSNCGEEMSEADKFCAQCGTYNDKYRAPVTAQAPKASVEEDSLTAETAVPEVAAPDTVATVTEEPAPKKAEPEVLYGYEQASYAPYAAPAAPAAPTAPTEEPKKEPPAVFGILALIFSIVDSLVGLVFSIIGMCIYKDKNSANRKRAKAGLIISIVLIAVAILAVFALVIFEVIADANGWVTPLSDPSAFFEYFEYYFSNFT